MKAKSGAYEIPYARQTISDSDIQAVLGVMRSDYLTQGPSVVGFEEAICSYCDAKYGVATNSATSALHIACKALNLGPKDLFWTSPISFVASANCALYCGAEVDFVDIDPYSYNLCPNALETKLKKAQKTGALPKIVMPVHFAGNPCRMSEIRQLSFKYGFKVIEDASHAVGSEWDSIKVGGCKHSDVTVFSFHPVKIITSAEGGMALTNDIEITDKMRQLRNHGILRNKYKACQQHSDEIWNYEQVCLGFNYRMNDLEAALGKSQLASIDTFIRKRNELANLYSSYLDDVPITSQKVNPDDISSYHLYSIRLNKDVTKHTQKAVYNHMHNQGVKVNLHYIPIHLQPYYSKLGFKRGDFPEAEKYYQECMSLPLYPSLQRDEVNYVCDQLLDVLR